MSRLNALLIIAIFRPKGMFSFMTDLKYVTNYIIYNIADVMYAKAPMIVSTEHITIYNSDLHKFNR